MTKDQCLDQMAHVLLGMNRRADERRATQKAPANRGPMQDEADWQKDLAS